MQLPPLLAFILILFGLLSTGALSEEIMLIRPIANGKTKLERTEFRKRVVAAVSKLATNHNSDLEKPFNTAYALSPADIATLLETALEGEVLQRSIYLHKLGGDMPKTLNREVSGTSLYKDFADLFVLFKLLERQESEPRDKDAPYTFVPLKAQVINQLKEIVVEIDAHLRGVKLEKVKAITNALFEVCKSRIASVLSREGTMSKPLRTAQQWELEESAVTSLRRFFTEGSYLSIGFIICDRFNYRSFISAF